MTHYSKPYLVVIFAGKNNYDYWKKIFETTKSPEGAQVLAKPF